MYNMELLKEWLLDCKIRCFSNRTVKSYRNNMERFFRWCSEQGIETIEGVNVSIIKQFILNLQTSGCKGTYINSLIKTLRAFFVYVSDEYEIFNPMIKIRWCREQQPIITAFSDDEVKAMLSLYNNKDFVSVRNKSILTVLFGTGLRCSELCNLMSCNIHDNFIQLVGKGGKERIVPIDAVLEKQLIKYKQKKEQYFKDKKIHSDTLFLSRTGRKLTNSAVEHMLSLAGEAAEIRECIRCSPHTCRHWYAQAQLKNGCDIYTLSKLLGHSNIKITQTYLNSMSDDDVIINGLKTSPLLFL